MAKFTFRVTQDLKAYYEGSVTIDATSEEEARQQLEAMPTETLEDLVEDWEQNTDNAESEGEITIQELKEVEDENHFYSIHVFHSRKNGFSFPFKTIHEDEDDILEAALNAGKIDLEDVEYVDDIDEIDENEYKLMGGL
jgi:hypothetical protein